MNFGNLNCPQQAIHQLQSKLKQALKCMLIILCDHWLSFYKPFDNVAINLIRSARNGEGLYIIVTLQPNIVSYLEHLVDVLFAAQHGTGHLLCHPLSVISSYSNNTICHYFMTEYVSCENNLIYIYVTIYSG